MQQKIKKTEMIKKLSMTFKNHTAYNSKYKT